MYAARTRLIDTLTSVEIFVTMAFLSICIYAKSYLEPTTKCWRDIRIRIIDLTRK